jgi:hypothetical protein
MEDLPKAPGNLGLEVVISIQPSGTCRGTVAIGRHKLSVGR